MGRRVHDAWVTSPWFAGFPSFVRRAMMSTMASARRKAPRLADRGALEPYEVRLSIRRPAVPTGETSEYLVEVDGEIVLVTDDGEERAGSVHAYVVEAERALEAGESIWDICDDTGDGLEDLCGVVFEEDGELRKEVSDGCRGNDVLFLRHADVLPGHRKQGLGLAAVLRIIEDFGRGCAIAVMKPFPLQLVGAEDDGADPEHTSAHRKSLALEGFEPDASRARKLLERYWAKLGFTRIEESELFVLDLGFERPSYDDLFGA
jgi:hypothetical protein